MAGTTTPQALSIDPPPRIIEQIPRSHHRLGGLHPVFLPDDPVHVVVLIDRLRVFLSQLLDHAPAPIVNRRTLAIVG